VANAPETLIVNSAETMQDALAALDKPGFKFRYDEYMVDGSLRYLISGADVNPSGFVLLFGVCMTRCGGLLPDEMPFNIVQKLLRAVLPPGSFPDYADDDYRKQFQDNWYGTNKKADLPVWLRSRKSSPTSTETQPGPSVDKGEDEIS